METLRELCAIAIMRAEDRSMVSAGRRRGKRVFVAPRLVFFLARRRVALIKDTARQLLLERPATRWSQFWQYLRSEEVTLTELIFAVGFLAKATIYPVAAFLLAITAFIAALSKAGLV